MIVNDVRIIYSLNCMRSDREGGTMAMIRLYCIVLYCIIFTPFHISADWSFFMIRLAYHSFIKNHQVLKILLWEIRNCKLNCCCRNCSVNIRCLWNPGSRIFVQF